MKVTVHYKGKGKVDASHKLWVWVFDSPNIGAGSMPMGQVALDKNDTDAVFDGIAAGKVYVAVAFDETGAMMGDAPPPTGTPIGILMGSDGTPESRDSRRCGAGCAHVRRFAADALTSSSFAQR